MGVQGHLRLVLHAIIAFYVVELLIDPIFD